MANRRHVTPLVVTATGYEPTDPEGKAYHAKLKIGSVVGGEIARSRSVVQNSLYWTVLTKVVETTTEYSSPEALHEVLKIETDRVEVVKLIDGRYVKIPSSTSFAALKHEAFCEYMEQAFRAIEKHFLGGMSIDEFMSHTDRAETNAAARIMREGTFGG